MGNWKLSTQFSLLDPALNHWRVWTKSRRKLIKEKNARHWIALPPCSQLHHHHQRGQFRFIKYLQTNLHAEIPVELRWMWQVSRVDMLIITSNIITSKIFCHSTSSLQRFVKSHTRKAAAERKSGEEKRLRYMRDMLKRILHFYIDIIIIFVMSTSFYYRF